MLNIFFNLTAIGTGEIAAETDSSYEAGIGYTPLFIFAAVSYLLVLLWWQLMLPEIKRAEP